ncbi:hypothetical protein [Kitasatospora aureofaciens]|uniref:hypothetical protein n=1 Tax=Kitasatospora aureofaciens TaxID=1894 RepID=UPI0033E78B18
MTSESTTSQDTAPHGEDQAGYSAAGVEAARVRLFEQLDRGYVNITRVELFNNGTGDLFVTRTDAEFRRLAPGVHRQIDRRVWKEAHAYAEALYGPRAQWPRNFTVERTAADAAEAYTEEEVEKATALFIEHLLEPAAKRTGRPLGDLFAEVADDLFGAWVLAFMMAGREVERGDAEPSAIVTRAGVIFVGALRKLPGREELARAAVGGIYHAARKAAGVE